MVEPTETAKTAASLADPATVARISGFIAIAGAVVGAVLTVIGHYLLNRQRAKYEFLALKQRLKHEERDRYVRTKLDAIERMLAAIASVDRLSSENASLFSGFFGRFEIESENLDVWANEIWDHATKCESLSSIYVPEIYDIALDVKPALNECFEVSAKYREKMIGEINKPLEKIDNRYVRPKGGIANASFLNQWRQSALKLRKILIKMRLELARIAREQRLVLQHVETDALAK